MRKLSFYLINLFIITSLLFVSCKENKKGDDTKNKTEKVTVDEFAVLVNHLETNGDFINSKAVPTMITAEVVFNNIDNEKFKIIDLRPSEAFAEGHIKNAINLPMKDLITYFESDPAIKSFDKIVFVCCSGQSASYATAIMRFLGYTNVFAMKAGMSSWNKELAKGYWLKNISNDFADKLELVYNDKAAKGAHPTIKTGKTVATEILRERAQNALNITYRSLLVNAPELFANPANYYTVNYWPEANYNEGHVVGSVQYTPKQSLSSKADLYTLPIDKEIVTYCFTGQHAAFVTAYLNILGYNAKSLAYGSNSFMHTVLLNKDSDWHAFTENKIANYNLVTE